MADKVQKVVNESAEIEATEEDNEEQVTLSAEESVITEEEENNDAEETEEVEEKVLRRFRRCERRKKETSPVMPVVRVSTEEDEEEGEEDEDEDEDEDEEEEEVKKDDEEGDEKNKYDEKTGSEYDSVYSAVPFEWENEIYEFIDLCDPGTMDFVYDMGSEIMLFDFWTQKSYLKLCDHTQVSPVIRFYNSLDTTKVDLSYHVLSPEQWFTVFNTLENNMSVEILILKNNPLVTRSCMFLSVLLSRNSNITVLDLTGCKIGPEGASLLAEGLDSNASIRELNLTKCYIEDEGMGHLVIPLKDSSIEKLMLSWNKLGGVSAETLGTLFSSQNSLHYLDLDYNNLYDPPSMKKFFKGLSVNRGITYLSLKWNGMSSVEIGNALAQCLRKNGVIQYLDLSDNRLDGVSLKPLGKALSKNESLEILLLSRNPLMAEDAEYLLPGLKGNQRLKLVELQEIWVRIEFVKSLNKIKQSKDIDVIYGGVYSDYKIYGPDYPAVILKRAQFEGLKPKKAKTKRDFGNLLFELGDDPVTVNYFMDKVKSFKAKVNKELYPELIKQFIIPKVNLVDVVKMRNKYLSLFPDFVPTEKKRKAGKNKREKKHKKGAEVPQVEEKEKYEPEINNAETTAVVEEGPTPQAKEQRKSGPETNDAEGILVA